MTYAVVAGTVVSVAGGAVSASAQRKQAKTAKRERRALLGFQIQAAERQNRIADQLEGLANKILNDEPISGQEMQLLNNARDIAVKGIQKARKEAVTGALGEQAATGFLRSGRAAEQLRRLNIESGEAQQRVELQREQAVAQTIQQRQQQAFGLLQGAAGIQTPQFQQFEQPLSSQALIGAGLTTLGGAAIQFGGQQAGIQAQQDVLRQQNLNQLQQAANQASLVKAQTPARGFDTTSF